MQEDTPKRIGIVGVGAIGSVLARGFDELGHEVLINDIDAAARESLPFPCREKAELAATCDVIVIALPTPTPSVAQGGDYSVIDDALAELHGTDSTVVIRSTMPPGSTWELAAKHDIPLVYSPEFLRDRSDVSEFFTPDRIVIAGPESERAVLRALMTDDRINECPVIETPDYTTAELGKYAHNALFAAKVSFANQMRLVAEASDAHPETVMDIVVADSRNTSSHLDPRLGAYGGKCLPKDLRALWHFARQQGVADDLFRATDSINQVAKQRFDERDIEGRWPNISVVEREPRAPQQD